MNIIAITGRLGQDPEMRYTPTGTAVTTLSVGVDRRMPDKDGHRATDWFRVVCWGKLAEVVAGHLTKGRLIGVTGEMQSHKWEKDGTTRMTWEVRADTVTFLDKPKDGGADATEEAEDDAAPF